MGLSFVEGEDQEGAAVYMIHNGSGFEERALENLKDELQRRGVRHQIQIFSSRAGDGEEILDFYDIMQTPAVLIVRDNDELFQYWVGQQLPDPGTLAHMVNTVSYR